jgi:hypothetical protein
MKHSEIPVSIPKIPKPKASELPAKSADSIDGPFIGSMKGYVVRYDDPFGPVVDQNDWQVLK